jgi:predicted ferric reductase
MSAIDLSSYVGLAALTLLTLNILIGYLLSTKYNPVRRWPHRRINTVKVHNWTGYAALCVAIVHPLVLLASSTAHFRLIDVVYPVNAPKQPWINALGALALYTLGLLVVTSYFRFAIGRRKWKVLHYTAYATAALFFAHGILTDPNLKNNPVDPLDGEKVYVEVCALCVIAGGIWRWRWQVQQGPARIHRPKQQRRAREVAPV